MAPRSSSNVLQISQRSLQINLGSPVLLEVWITLDEQYEVPIYLSCLRDRCQVIFAVKLQKCFTDYDASSDFPSTRGLSR